MNVDLLNFGPPKEEMVMVEEGEEDLEEEDLEEEEHFEGLDSSESSGSFRDFDEPAYPQDLDDEDSDELAYLQILEDFKLWEYRVAPRT